MNSQQAALMIAGLIGFLGVLGGVHWLSTHGTTIASGPCRWASEAEHYETSVTLKNQQDEYTIVQVMVQGRFHPPKGRQWPHARLRSAYEAITEKLNVPLRPGETRTAPIVFAIPGITGFLCTAHARIAGQDRLGRHPAADVVDALQ